MENFKIHNLAPTETGWSAYEAFLHTADLYAIFEGLGADKLLEESHFLAAVVGEIYVGVLIFVVQPLGPEMDVPVICNTEGRPLKEAKVRAFYVDPAYRNQGIGTGLQKALLSQAQHLGCYQVRSRSELDKAANYAIKLKLGFAIHPAVRTFKDGRTSAGVYWVKAV